jgi:hypothetical protein
VSDWFCGVFDAEKGFERRSSGESTLDRAKAVLRLRVESGSQSATLPGEGIPISEALDDFMQLTRDGGARESSIKKYRTLMDQLQAFADWKGFRFLDELDQDGVLEFRRAWEDPNAGYKRSAVREDGRPMWGTQSIGTCRRNAKIMRSFFERGIGRKWIRENRPAY